MKWFRRRRSLVDRINAYTAFPPPVRIDLIRGSDGNVIGWKKAAA